MNIKQIIITMFFVFTLQIFAAGQTIKQNAERQNPTPNNLSQEIKKVLEKWLSARESRDSAALEQLVLDDYEFIAEDGTVFNKSQLFGESKLIEVDLPTVLVSNLKIEIEGDAALVTFIAKTNTTNKKFDGEALERTQKNVRANWLIWESQIRRRTDLMPNLYQEVVKNVGIAEDELLGQAAAARSKLLNAILDPPKNGSNKSTEQIKSVIEANDEFGKIIIKITNLPENYPQLRSNENFLRLTDELAGIENRIAVARNDYYVAVRYLNKSLDTRNDKTIANWKKINGLWKLTAERAEKTDQ